MFSEDVTNNQIALKIWENFKNEWRKFMQTIFTNSSNSMLWASKLLHMLEQHSNEIALNKRDFAIFLRRYSSGDIAQIERAAAEYCIVSVP